MCSQPQRASDGDTGDRSEVVFRLIEAHHLYRFVRDKACALLAVNEPAALRLLSEHRDEVRACRPRRSTHCFLLSPVHPSCIPHVCENVLGMCVVV